MLWKYFYRTSYGHAHFASYAHSEQYIMEEQWNLWNLSRQNRNTWGSNIHQYPVTWAFWSIRFHTMNDPYSIILWIRLAWPHVTLFSPEILDWFPMTFQPWLLKVVGVKLEKTNNKHWQTPLCTIDWKELIQATRI